MAKFGYRCQCGWSLRRGNQTRKQYADAKRKHAAGDLNAEPPIEPCDFLKRELARTPRMAKA